MHELPLPEKFIQRLQRIIPDRDWEMVWHSFHTPKPLVLRVNTLHTTTSQILNELAALGITTHRVEWKDDAIIVPHPQRELALTSHIYQQGLIYSQNLSSQLAPLLLDPQPGEQVLDLCAAPGGKTLQMAAMMKDEGHIGAVESVKARYFKLKANLESQGVSCVKTYLTNGIHVWRKTPERFNRVLVDAPCSSESRFKADQPSTFKHWSENKIKQVARKQKALLYSGIQSLSPGGSLIYSTCSFAPEENEAIVHHALKRFGDRIAISPLEVPVNNIQHGMTEWRNDTYHPDLEKCVRIIPNDVMDGFFICRILKRESTLKLGEHNED